jgi:hypothetical protein
MNSKKLNTARSADARSTTQQIRFQLIAAEIAWDV